MINFNEYEEMVKPYHDTIDHQQGVIDKLSGKIEKLKKENKELKMQLYSDDQIRVKCPNCGEKIIVNECRTVSDLKDRINKAIGLINVCGKELNKDQIRYLLEILEGED